MKISDRLSGVFLLLLGLITFWGGSQFPPVPGQQVGPSAFPMVTGAGLMLMGALIALHIGRSFEEEAEAELAKHAAPDVEGETYAHKRRWLVLLPPTLLVFYYLASERIGFIPTAIVMIATMAFAFDAKKEHILPLAIGGALFIQIIFVKLLRVPLAPGLFPVPW
jgi:putative tricarboxylic transport membrane protein